MVVLVPGLGRVSGYSWSIEWTQSRLRLLWGMLVREEFESFLVGSGSWWGERFSDVIVTLLGGS